MEEVVGGLQYESTSMKIRLFAQYTGIVLLVIGVAVSLHIMFKVLKILDDPSQMIGPVQAFEEVLGTDSIIATEEGEVRVGDATIKTRQGEINVGRILAVAAFSMWMLICIWIPLSMVHVGAKMIAWNVDERQIRKIAKELMSKMKEGK